jgi:hypothetical protein
VRKELSTPAGNRQTLYDRIRNTDAWLHSIAMHTCDARPLGVCSPFASMHTSSDVILNGHSITQHRRQREKSIRQRAREMPLVQLADYLGALLPVLRLPLLQQLHIARMHCCPKGRSLLQVHHSRRQRWLTKRRLCSREARRTRQQLLASGRHR